MVPSRLDDPILVDAFVKLGPTLEQLWLSENAAVTGNLPSVFANVSLFPKLNILDVGSTLLSIIEACKAQGAASVKTCVLVDKQHDRKARPGLKADFTALEADDYYLFGMGMDYKGFWRNAPGIYAVRESDL